jgi:hypothetical protein
MAAARITTGLGDARTMVRLRLIINLPEPTGTAGYLLTHADPS